MSERRAEPATSVGAELRETGVGSNFVSNYPPYSAWSEGALDAARAALSAPPEAARRLGLYLHVPFCRKRCKFCYFRVYTDKNSADVQRYLDAVVTEATRYAEMPALVGRQATFLYFGGGTPSYVSAKHLEQLSVRLGELFPLTSDAEVTFECEPGTLTRAKLEVIRRIGVTRLSLGVENFDDTILRENGRAHVSEEIERVLPWIAELDFDQVNIDLIAGMVGESWDNWRTTVQRTIDADPDSVTIYQMELPFNTVYSKSVLDGRPVAIADWPTKRAWHAYAIEALGRAGYEVASAYTMVKRSGGASFVYRDSVWHGEDLLGLGVSSFSHVSGVHFQNLAGWDPYLEAVESGQLALARGFVPTPRERMTREVILQLKLGHVEAGYFDHKFGSGTLEGFSEVWERLREQGMLERSPTGVRLTPEGLLRVDQLLPELYAPEYQNARYT